MQFEIEIEGVFRCSIERAFKAPMLCDISKVHTGFLVMPKVTHCTNDADWGKVGSTKRVIGARSIAFKGGEASTDRVLERIENEYWKIQVDDFQTWIMGFERFVGEWRVRALDANETHIRYTYTLHAAAPWLAPMQWLFARLFWPVYMRRVMNNVRVLAEGDAPFLYP